MKPSWRQQAQKVIFETLEKLPATASLDEKRRALFDAYPFGPREHHPYKIWCDEVGITLGTKKKPTPEPAPLFDGDDFCEMRSEYG